MTLPVLDLTGTPFAQGRRHGQELRDRIAHNVDVYFTRFEREVGLPRPEVLDRAGQWLTRSEAQNADYFENLRGVADGSGFGLPELAALNLRYEILYYQFGKNALAVAAEPDGCTAFAVLPEAAANGHLLLGQNWDWIPDVQGAILHTSEPDGLETVAFTEAGIVGAKIGLNSAGLGLCINGMTTIADDWSRPVTPFHVRCYEILRCPDFDRAVSIITDEKRACSTNFLLAQTPNRVVDVEAAPDQTRLLPPEGGCLVHTNHFLDPEGTGIVEPPNERRVYSCFRRDRIGALLRSQTPVTVSDIQADLRDHEEWPFGVCRHRNPAEPPEKHYITVASAIMDLDARTLHLTDGPPCESGYQTFSLAS